MRTPQSISKSSVVVLGAALSAASLPSCSASKPSDRPQSIAATNVIDRPVAAETPPVFELVEVPESHRSALIVADAAQKIVDLARLHETIAASVKGPTLQTLLERARKSTLIDDLERRGELLLTELRSGDETRLVAGLDRLWHDCGLLVSAIQSNNLQLQVHERAALSLSELAQNEPLKEMFSRDLAELTAASQELARVSLMLTAALRKQGIDVSAFQVRVSSPILAPDRLVKDWRIVLESALRASESIPGKLLLSPDQNVEMTREFLGSCLFDATRAPGSLKTETTIASMLLARSLIRATQDALRDDIAVATLVHQHVMSLPDEQRQKNLAEDTATEVLKMQVRLKLFHADMRDANISLKRLDALSQREPRLDVRPAELKLQP